MPLPPEGKIARSSGSAPWRGRHRCGSPTTGAPAARDGPLPQQAGFVDIAIALEAGAGEIRIAKEGKGLEHSALRWRARQGPKGGIEGNQRHLECSQGCRIQSAPRRHGRMQLLRTTGCSEQEGDGEAHQGQSGQTGGSKNREGLDQRQLQHGQNLEQSLRTAIIPACYRCNPSWQGSSGKRQLKCSAGQPGLAGGAAWADPHQGDQHKTVAFS